MQIKHKKILASVLAMSMLVPLSLSVYSDEEPTEEAAVEETEEASADEEREVITDEMAMENMKLVAKNSKLEFYRSSQKKSSVIALKDLSTGKIWWSNPINADNSNAKKAQKNQLKAGLDLIYAEPANRRTTSINSQAKSDFTITDINNGIRIEYKFSDCEITVPVEITLEEDYLKVYCDTKQINETYKSSTSGMLTQTLSFYSTFAAADASKEGYFVIPDGSGAVINYNNQKTGYKVYSAPVYGEDITPVKQTARYTTQNVFLNMYGIVEGDSGLMVVADKGDAAASINAYVAGENNTEYNACYFSFETRTDDEYMMGGDSNPLKVFEKRGLRVPEIELRYYPVSDGGNEIDYVDIAEKYRYYLTESMGNPDKVTKSEKADDISLYVDMYGATLKKQSILGIPVTVKTKVTGFDDALRIVTDLGERGVDDMVVNYMDWTTADISEKITDSASPASVLGGSSKWKKLNNYADSNNIELYPDADNLLFKNSFSYSTITNTAIRVSNSYSRQIIFDLAHGTENKFYKSLALFSPASYEKAFGKLAASYDKKGLENISMGSLANTIYGDYGKKAVSREIAKGYVQNVYRNAENKVGAVMASGANAYVLPYVDRISNIPLSSSKFDLFDEDIPFYQIVMHGLVPYSTTAVNGDADIGDIILRAVACGSNLNFDMIGEEASELKDTKYDKYFYAYYKNWEDDAAGAYKFMKQVLGNVAGSEIVSYKQEGKTIETVYDNNCTITVDLEKLSAKVDNEEYFLEDYLTKGVIG